jgi:hypothetical protein
MIASNGIVWQMPPSIDSKGAHFLEWATDAVKETLTIAACMKRGNHNRHVTVNGRGTGDERVIVICGDCHQPTTVLR